MKIEIEVGDLKTFVNAFNNAYLAYNDIVSGVLLGLTQDIPYKLRPLASMAEEELLARRKSLYDVYPQLLAIEEAVDKNSKT